jgi:hypothetical protein
MFVTRQLTKSFSNIIFCDFHLGKKMEQKIAVCLPNAVKLFVEERLPVLIVKSWLYHVLFREKTKWCSTVWKPPAFDSAKTLQAGKISRKRSPSPRSNLLLYDEKKGARGLHHRDEKLSPFYKWNKKVLVPRRLFFTALQWIAIAQGPKIYQKKAL